MGIINVNLRTTTPSNHRDYGVISNDGIRRHVNTFFTKEEFPTRQHLEHGTGQHHHTIKMRLHLRNWHLDDAATSSTPHFLVEPTNHRHSTTGRHKTTNTNQHRGNRLIGQNGRAKCPSPMSCAFFPLIESFIFSAGCLTLLSFLSTMEKPKPNIHSDNNNFLRGART
jgi:hypothetical protein